MIEERQWDGGAERILQLQDKINGYLSFAFDGQMETQYPGSAGKLLRFQLNCPTISDEQTKKFIQLVKAHLAQKNIEFIVKFTE